MVALCWYNQMSDISINTLGTDEPALFITQNIWITDVNSPGMQKGVSGTPRPPMCTHLNRIHDV